MAKPPYKYNSSQVLYQRKPEGMLPLTYSEWERIKSMVGKIKSPIQVNNTMGSICVGLFTTSVVTLFTFNEKTNNWCRVTILCICILSFILAIVFYYLHYTQESGLSVLGQDIIDEMNSIEKKFDTSLSDGTEYPL
jgi:hypothetical protein